MMRHLTPLAIILLIACAAPSGAAPGIIIHPFMSLGAEPLDTTRVTNALGAHLSAGLHLPVTAARRTEKPTARDLLTAQAPGDVLAGDDPVLRVTGVVARDEQGRRLVQVAALRPDAEQLGLGLPVAWPQDAPVPVAALAREAARALGPVAHVPDVEREGEGMARALHIQPLLPLPAGDYWLCEGLAPGDARATGAGVCLTRAVGAVTLGEAVEGEAWVRPARVTGAVRGGLWLALKTPEPPAWPQDAQPLVLRSRPAPALVALDGAFVGVTPGLAALPAGRHRLTFRAPDGTTREATAWVDRAAATELAVSLEAPRPQEDRPATCRLTVRSDPRGAQVLVNGRTVGKTPLRGAGIPDGPLEVSLLADGHETWSTRLDLAPGKSAELEVQLARAQPPAAQEEVAEPRPAAAGPLAQARNLPLPTRPAQGGEVFSLPVLTGKGSPRVREARVEIARDGDGDRTVQAKVSMDEGLPEGTRIAAAGDMVSVVIPDALALEGERARREVQVGGIAAVQAGQQSERERTVRVQLDLHKTATVHVREDPAGGRVRLEVALPDPPQPAPAPRQLERPPGGLWFQYPEPTKRIALTFDDFPSEGVSDRLLAVLREHGVRATFFVIGRKAERSPWLVRAAMEDGHTLGNHTYSHPRLVGLDWMTVYNEVDRCSRLLAQITGSRPRYFRPPGGGRNDMVNKIVGELGMRTVMWQASSRDYEDPPPAQIVADILKTTRDRNNVVAMLHDGHNNTIAALPEIIHELRRRGYRFVTLDELLGH